MHALKTAAPSALTKINPSMPALVVARKILIRAGTVFRGHAFAEDMPVPLHEGPGEQPGYIAGQDYFVSVAEGKIGVSQAVGKAEGDCLLGGFHYAPGGNAVSRAGGDGEPAINPWSTWDLNFRPACADPRGMTFVVGPHGFFWCDIYLTASITSPMERAGSATRSPIGDNPPVNPAGGKFSGFDYETACAVMAHHGKGLLGVEEFFAAAYGVTEKTACRRDPQVTGLDVPRTSKFGLIQATGNMWVWGHDGDPDEPRASIFGGSWRNGGNAGSRVAIVGNWPGNSSDDLGARGRCDHLQRD